MVNAEKIKEENEIIKKNSKENKYITIILQEGAKGTELENYVFDINNNKRYSH